MHALRKYALPGHVQTSLVVYFDKPSASGESHIGVPSAARGANCELAQQSYPRARLSGDVDESAGRIRARFVLNWTNKPESAMAPAPMRGRESGSAGMALVMHATQCGLESRLPRSPGWHGHRHEMPWPALLPRKPCCADDFPTGRPPQARIPACPNRAPLPYEGPRQARGTTLDVVTGRCGARTHHIDPNTATPAPHERK